MGEESDVQEYVKQLRTTPVDDVIVDVVSALLGVAQAKLCERRHPVQLDRVERGVPDVVGDGLHGAGLRRRARGDGDLDDAGPCSAECRQGH